MAANKEFKIKFDFDEIVKVACLANCCWKNQMGFTCELKSITIDETGKCKDFLLLKDD